MKHLSWRRYHIHFTDSVQLDRPLLPEQAAYLQRFLSTRRVSWSSDYVQELPDPLREAVGLPVGHEGAYFTGLSCDELKVDVWQPLVKDQKLEQNKPPQGQPRLWCAWRLGKDGITLRYADKRELYFCYAWLSYLIEHFFTPWGYQLTGEIIWQGDDEADHGKIIVKQNLIEHQLLQNTGEKILVRPDEPIACVHQNALETKLVCIHLANQGLHRGYTRWFTGQGRDFYPVCKQCAEAIKQGETAIPLGQICWRCYHEQEVQGDIRKMVGQPEVFVRSSNLSLIQQRQPFPFSERILALQPVDTHAESIWIAFTNQSNLIKFNLTTGSVIHLAHLSDASAYLEEDVTLHLAPDGTYVALAQATGTSGVVLDLRTGKATMQLERFAEYAEYTQFPLAFFEQDERVHLIYDSQQHGLAVFDPSTGELVSDKPVMSCEYHGTLTVSPNQEWIVDHGWVWHPVGMVVAWKLQRWLHAQDWDERNDPSLLELCNQDSWNGPLCWINDRIVAVWGFGSDEEDLMPAVRLFDVVAEKEIGWFAGPEGTLAYDEYLFAMSEKQGLTAWDVATGERVLADPDFHPTHYHRGAKQFLQIDAQQNTFHLGRLVDKHTSSS